MQSTPAFLGRLALWDPWKTLGNSGLEHNPTPRWKMLPSYHRNALLVLCSMWYAFANYFFRLLKLSLNCLINVKSQDEVVLKWENMSRK